MSILIRDLKYAILYMLKYWQYLKHISLLCLNSTANTNYPIWLSLFHTLT